jgi:hypothetical protein
MLGIRILDAEHVSPELALWHSNWYLILPENTKMT